MAPPPLRDEDLQAAVDGVARHGTIAGAARAMRIPYATLQHRLAMADRRGIKPSQAPPPPPAEPRRHGPPLPDRILPALRAKPAPLAALAKLAGVAEADIAGALVDLEAAGFRLLRTGDSVALDTRPPPPRADSGITLHTDAEGWITLGLTGDNHLGSRYERLDVLEALYDVFAAEGVAAALNAGNWIDGEARFNTHDLHTHGMDAQLRYLAQHYPMRAGVETWAVAGDDHEGWYAGREGVDIGRYAERVMRDAGRQDWHDAGYMESPIRIVHAGSGQSCTLLLVHPGGGSAYALSYRPQKIVESMDGGEKPAVLVLGHYHKLMGATSVRNVWVVQSGCTQDQTPFMRKKGLEAHVGGIVMRLLLDPATGAAVRCQTECLRFFNGDYYARRWSRHGPVRSSTRVDAAGRPIVRVKAPGKAA